MKYLIFAVSLLLLGSQLASSQSPPTFSKPVVSQDSREFASTLVLKNAGQKESDAAELFVALGYAVRHEPLAPGLLERIVGRANSKKVGGLYDHRTVIKAVALFSSDFVLYEQERIRNEENQDKTIRELLERIDKQDRVIDDLRKEIEHKD